MIEPEFLTGKRALVTGGAKRIGRAVALALARYGADVVTHYNRSEKEAHETANDIQAMGRKAWCVQTDLSKENAVMRLIPEAVSVAGQLDILVNSAADFPESTLQTVTFSGIADEMRLNAYTPLALARAFAEQEQPGHIINFLDTRIVDYDKEHVAYHLSKRAMFALTRQMAAEFAPDIQVNAVAPGLVLPPPGKDDRYLEALHHTNPLQRHGTLEDITRTVLFFLANSFVTGQVIYVDGGRHMEGRFYGS